MQTQFYKGFVKLCKGPIKNEMQLFDDHNGTNTFQKSCNKVLFAAVVFFLNSSL